jgi:hypothetical protein
LPTFQENVDVHNVNVRLKLLGKVWKEYNAVQDQLEYDDDDDDDDDETQQHELDRVAFTETYCELRARIYRIIADDRKAGEVRQNQMPRTLHENVIRQRLRSNCPLLKFQNLEVE